MPDQNSRNVFEWRTTYNDLATKFIYYACHTNSCSSRAHVHHTPSDDRITCTEAPCTCELVAVLAALSPTIEYIIPCPDVALNRPGTIFSLPVVENSTIPYGRIWLGDVEVTETDADTGKPIARGISPLHQVTGIVDRDYMANANANATNMGWCIWHDEASCISNRQSQGLPPCTKNHHNPARPGLCRYHNEKDCQLHRSYSSLVAIRNTRCELEHHVPRVHKVP